MSYKVEKILIVKNPTQFFRILVDKDWMSGGVDNFLKTYFKWQDGCYCDNEKLWSRVVDEYKKLDETNLVGLKSRIGCDKIEFKYDNN